MDQPNRINIGNVLIDLKSGNNIGVIVNIIYTTNDIILFRIDKNVQPTFSKLNLSNILNGNIAVRGNINNFEYNDLKISLLRYYRTHNLTKTEEGILHDLMIYAFPNGIPEYKSHNVVQELIVKANHLTDKLKPGATFYLNTTEPSNFTHLNNKIIYIVKVTDKGIWVCDDLKSMVFSFIPYKDANIPTFYGISKLLDNTGTTCTADDLNTLQTQFKKHETDKLLFSQIIHDGVRMKLDPAQDDKIIIPVKYAGQYYDFKHGRIHSSTTGPDVREQLYNNEPLIYSPVSQDIPVISSETNMLEENPAVLSWLEKLDTFNRHNDMLDSRSGVQVGGKEIVDGGNNIDTTDKASSSDIDDDLLILMNKTPATTNKDTGNLSEDEIRERDAEAEDDNEFGEFEEMEGIQVEDGVYQKIRQIAVPELQRTFKESIFKGQLRKQKLEKLPLILRGENSVFTQKIEKEINMISLIKSQITLEDKTVKLTEPDYKPLANKYSKRIFAGNTFLIPLVISTRKIFLTKKDKVTGEDFNQTNTIVTEDYLKSIAITENEKMAGGHRRLVNLDEELGKQTVIQAPFITHKSNLGLLIRLGEKIIPEDMQNENSTLKLNFDKSAEKLDLGHQETLVIQYGEKPFEIENFGLTTHNYDSFMALGPLSRFINEEKRDYTIAELELMDEQIDRNIDVISNTHKIYYYGDNLNLVGFVRPPVDNFIDIHDTMKIKGKTIQEMLMDEDNVIVKHLHKIDDDSMTLDDPTKYIIYLFPGVSGASGKDMIINEQVLKQYLHNIVPKVDDVVELFRKTWDINNVNDMYRMIDILGKFDYYVHNEDYLINSYSRGNYKLNVSHKPQKLNYDEHERTMGKLEADLIAVMADYSNKMDKLYKLNNYRHKQKKEKAGLSSRSGTMAVTNDSTHPAISKAKIVTNDLIELADKIYGETFDKLSGGMDNPLTETDEFRLNFYSNQEPDNSRLMNLLIRQKTLMTYEKENNKEKLENTLFMLKHKYETLAFQNNINIDSKGLSPELSAKLKTCDARLDRKPKIIRYPSVERLKQDNGRVITNSKGEVILSGDYAIVDESGQKYIFKREQLMNGDYWIGQPLSVLEEILLKKKRDTCENDMDNPAKKAMMDKMKLPGEQLKDTESDPDRRKLLTGPEFDICTFNPETLTCLPLELSGPTLELRELELRIRDITTQLDFVNNIPMQLADNKQKMAAVETEIQGYKSGLNSLDAYYKAKHDANQKLLESIIQRKKACVHFSVVDYLFGLTNLTDLEKFNLAKQIIERFQNTEQMDSLLLDKYDAEDNKNNNIECYICNQTLLCKHYAYAIKLLEDNNVSILDDTKLIEIYGENNGGSYYCRSCGVQIANTDVTDTEEYEKGGGAKEGMLMKTREVLEDVNIVEKQKHAIEAIMNEALLGEENNEDLKQKLRVYKLLKDLCGLKMLVIDDELEMINFIKTYSSGITRKAFFNRYYLTFIKAGKQVLPAVIDKLATADYWKYITADIMCRYLITIQTSKLTYNVNNKLINTNYMGWPLLDKTDMNGIDMLFGLAKQMALIADFGYLSGTTGLDAFRQLLIERMTDLLKNDELVRTRVERSLDYKFQMITMLEEKESSPTNYWPMFKPAMTIFTNVGWSPHQDVSRDIYDNWSGVTLRNILAVTTDNLIYQAQLLKHNTTQELKKLSPTTRLTLNTSLANGFTPIDFSMKDVEPNYYSSLMKTNPAIGANINKISVYADIYKQLTTITNGTRLIVNMPPLAKIYASLVFNINMDEVLLRDYFTKFIDSGIHRGDTHLFNSYGRCLISNQFKKDVLAMRYTQADFMKLFRMVSEKNRKHDVVLFEDPNRLLDIEKYDASQFVIRLINVLQGFKTNLSSLVNSKVINTLTKIAININTALAPKLIEEVYYEMDMRSKLYALMEDYETIYNLLIIIDNNKPNFKESFEFKHFVTYLEELLDICNKTLYDVILEYLKTGILSKETVQNLDTKKMYYNLISKIQTQTQVLITSVIDNMVLTNKEEAEMDAFLVDLGDLKDIKQDYKLRLEHYEQILEHIDYFNIDLETDILGLTNRVNMIKGHFKALKSILLNLKNNSWAVFKTGADILDKHFVTFYKYKDNKKLFSKLWPNISIYFKIYDSISYGTTNRVIGPDIAVCIIQHIFFMLLSEIIIVEPETSYKTSTLVSSSDIDSTDDSSLASQMKATPYQTPLDNMELDVNYSGEFDNEPGEVLEDEQLPGYATKLIKTQKTNHEILTSFVKDYIYYIKGTEYLYNEMNVKHINEQKAMTYEKQKRQNLGVFKFLNQQGLEEDYRAIMAKMAIGELDYKNLDEFVTEYFGAEYGDAGYNDMDNIPEDDMGATAESNDIGKFDEQAKNNKLGLDDYEMEEMGFVGVAEDMEEMDYGNLGVDED